MAFRCRNVRGSRFGFRSGLCFADALLETVFTAVAASIQFLGALSFLMTHDALPKEIFFNPSTYIQQIKMSSP